MSFANAIQALLGQNYNSFLLTVLSITVCIYLTPNAKFKIFDSHARDLFGIPHPKGTCVLLDVNTINDLMNYFGHIFKCFIKIQMFYLNSKVYILMKYSLIFIKFFLTCGYAKGV